MSEQNTTNGGRASHIPDTSRYAPGTSRYKPDTSRYVPDTSQYKPKVSTGAKQAAKYKLKTPKGMEEGVVGAFGAIEDGVVGTYRKIEDGVVGAYKKIEGKFIDAFLEPVEQPEGESAENTGEQGAGAQPQA